MISFEFRYTSQGFFKIVIASFEIDDVVYKTPLAMTIWYKWLKN